MEDYKKKGYEENDKVHNRQRILMHEIANRFLKAVIPFQSNWHKVLDMRIVAMSYNQIKRNKKFIALC